MTGSTQSPALDGESLFPLTTVYSVNWEGEGPGVGLLGLQESIITRQRYTPFLQFRIVHNVTQHLSNFSLMNKRLIEIALINLS